MKNNSGTAGTLARKLQLLINLGGLIGSAETVYYIFRGELPPFLKAGSPVLGFLVFLSIALVGRFVLFLLGQLIPSIRRLFLRRTKISEFTFGVAGAALLLLWLGLSFDYRVAFRASFFAFVIALILFGIEVIRLFLEIIQKKEE